MRYIDVHTQAELNTALANRKTGDIIVCRGNGHFEASDSASVWAYDSASVQASGSASVQAYGSASVQAYGSASVEASGSASVEAYGSASVRAYGSASVQASGSASVQASGSASVQAYDSASVEASGSASVEASGSASVRAYDSASVQASGSASVQASGSASVQAYDSASVWASGSASVQAYGSASVWASGSASVRASKYVAVHKMPGHKKKISGGVIIEVPKLTDAKSWLDYHGVKTVRGIAILFKAVDDTYGANHNGFKYEPGTKPACDDWNAEPVCGGGLHFCTRPWVAKSRYHQSATRYVGCPVKVAEIVVIDESKVKAPRVFGAVFECDEDGVALARPKGAS